MLVARNKVFQVCSTLPADSNINGAFCRRSFTTTLSYLHVHIYLDLFHNMLHHFVLVVLFKFCC